MDHIANLQLLALSLGPEPPPVPPSLIGALRDVMARLIPGGGCLQIPYHVAEWEGATSGDRVDAYRRHIAVLRAASYVIAGRERHRTKAPYRIRWQEYVLAVPAPDGSSYGYRLWRIVPAAAPIHVASPAAVPLIANKWGPHNT